MGTSTVISDDLGVLAERIQPFAPMEVTRRKLWEVHDEYKKKVANLDDLRNGGRMSCPIHKHGDGVIITGGGRNGGKSSRAGSTTIQSSRVETRRSSGSPRSPPTRLTRCVRIFYPRQWPS